LKKFFAKVVLAVAQNIGSPGLNLVRKVLPVSVKLALSHVVTNNIQIDAPFIEAGNGLKFMPIKDTVFLHVRMEGFYEKGISDITARIVRAGDLVIDIGANFGWYTMLLCKGVGPNGQVHSFEPNSKMFSVLTQNIALNDFQDRAFAKQIGIGSEKNVAHLSASEGEFGLGHIVNERELSTANSKDVQQVQIDMLDSLFASSVGRISFIKIDVEGFEPFVIKGGKAIFESENPPIIQIEFNSEALLEHSPETRREFVEYLNSMDADIYAGQTGSLVKIQSIRLGENADLFIFPRTGEYAGRRLI
jgi:FkbM family methyltransferase